MVNAVLALYTSAPDRCIDDSFPVHSPLHVGPPGLVRQMTAEGLDVGCGSGVLRITRLQKPGGTMQSVAQWLQGGADLTGLMLG